MTVAKGSTASLTESRSTAVIVSDTTVAGSFSVYAKLVASTSPSSGTSFTGATATMRTTGVLPALLLSVITNDTVRSVFVGSSDELWNVTERSAACQSATATFVPVSVSTPLT